MIWLWLAFGIMLVSFGWWCWLHFATDNEEPIRELDGWDDWDSPEDTVWDNM